MGRKPRTPDQRRAVVEAYLAKRQLYPFQVSAKIPADLGIVVVIPCLAEPGLDDTLASLAACSPPRCRAEVIVVVNHSSEADAGVRNQSAENLALLRAAGGPALPVHALDHRDLPARHAGVGLARKLGLDQAAARLAGSAAGGGVLVCLDADCTVDSGYLQAIEAHFSNPAVQAATLAFEHPLEGPDGGLAIARYELHLRYFVEAQRWAGMPQAMHTVGSCMALRSDWYARQGGMNRRQAGEDYYFLQKLAAAGPVSELNATRVYPSPRRSWRVPFGTGRAIADTTGRHLDTYHPAVFAELRQWLRQVPGLRDADTGTSGSDLPAGLSAWLVDQGLDRQLDQARRHTASTEQFTRRMFRWFNAFRCLKYVHHASAQRWGRVPVEQAAATLLEWLGESPLPAADAFALLRRYRIRQGVIALSCADSPRVAGGARGGPGRPVAG